MIHKIDGDQLMIAANSFQDLQASPAVFIPLDSEMAKEILAESHCWVYKRIEGKHMYEAVITKWLNEVGAVDFRIERNAHDYIVFAYVPAARHPGESTG